MTGRREVLGVVLAVAVVAASLATSPSATLAALAALTANPVRFASILAVLYVIRPAVAWPTVGVSMLVGFAYGPWLGLPVALCGVVVTSLPPFYAARWFGAGSDALSRLGEKGRAYLAVAGDVRGVTAARLAPVPADVVSCAAGVSGVSLRSYAAGTLVGELPWTVAAVLVGASAKTMTTAGLSGIGLPLAVATTVAAVVVLAGPTYRALGDGRLRNANGLEFTFK